MRVAPKLTPLRLPAFAEGLRPDVEIVRAGDRSAGVIRLLSGRVEQHLDRIADDLGDRALMREHDVGHAADIFVEQLAQHFRCNRLHQRGEAGDVGEDRGDLAPVHRHAVGLAVAGQAACDLRREIARQRSVRALGLELAAARLAHHLDMADSLVDRHFEVAEIDRLGEEIERAAVHRGADIAHVTIGGDDDGRFLVVGLLQLRQQRQPVHPGHVDVGDHHVDMRMLLDRGQRLDPVMGEHKRNRPITDPLAEFLQHQSLEIGLVVDDQDRCSHAACPSLVSISWRNSAKSIGLVRSPTAPRSIALRRVSASP